MGTSRVVCTLAVLIAALSLRAAADQAWFAGINYDNVTIQEVNEKTISFLWEDHQVVKPNDLGLRLEIAGFDDFNKAEALLANKEYVKAVAAYNAATKTAAGDQQKLLVQARLPLAKSAKAPAAAPAPDATPAPAAPSGTGGKKCSFCNDTGRVPCPDCKGAGVAKCPACKDGYIPCDKCAGKGKSPCSHCEGTGKGKSYTDAAGNTLQKPCRFCNGTGFEKCPKCADSPRPGFIICPTCHGSGVGATCPTCHGLKTVPCTHCELGKKEAQIQAAFDKMHTPATASAPADNPAATATQPAPAPKVTGLADAKWADADTKDPLTSPEAMFKLTSTAPEPPNKSPEWESMTSLQQDKAQQQYEKDLSAWKDKNDFHQKQVTWTLRVQDVEAIREGTGFALLVSSRTNLVVRANIPADQEAMMTALKKGQMVSVVGTVTEYGNGPKTHEKELFDAKTTRYDFLLGESKVKVLDTPATQP